MPTSKKCKQAVKMKSLRKQANLQQSKKINPESTELDEMRSHGAKINNDTKQSTNIHQKK